MKVPLLLLKVWPLSTVLLVPFLIFLAPPPLSLSGVGASWPVIWLLPWALVDGPISGVLAGVVLGLLLDDIWGGGFSGLLSLALLGGFWGYCGCIGVKSPWSLGILAMLGSLFLGGVSLLRAWMDIGWKLLPVFHSILAQAVLTALLAPLLSSIVLRLWVRVCPRLRS